MTEPESWKGIRKLLEKESLVDILRLIRSDHVGPVTFFNLVRQFGGVKSALDAIPQLAARGGKRAVTLCYSAQDAEREIEQTQAFGARMIHFGDNYYPELLRGIYDPPPALAVLGSCGMWKSSKNIAIVGARNASANGYQIAKKLGSDAGEKGMIVISGLARGIDTAAHSGALKTGTVAVMASGIDQAYPPENKALYDAIAAQGAIVTEQPFGMAPHARSFPGRNRIISGMALGVVVVEASLKSGSLITARFALDQNRDVFAVPGSPLDPRCKGSNSLIKQGAIMCESAEDITASLGQTQEFTFNEQESSEFDEPGAMQPGESELNEARKIVVSKLGFSAVSVDELLVQCALTPNVLSLILLELELAGRLARLPGHKVCLHAEETLSQQVNA